jgi:hypothetical protein
MKQCKHPTCGTTCRREKKQVKGFNSKAIGQMAGSDAEELKILPVPLLMKLAIHEFNAYIRLRDYKNRCISCQRTEVEHAGHYLPAGTYSGIRFNEINVNGQCSFCNSNQDGNLEEYNAGMVLKYGALEILALTKLGERTKFHKWDRSELIDIIIEYRNKPVSK